MERVRKNTVVSITYVLRDQQGDIFEYTDLPVSYVHGGGHELFDKIERALEGHAVGDKITVDLSPEEGFGEPDPRLRFTDDVDNVPEELRRIGTQLETQNDRGEVLQFTVTRIEGGKLTVDANHPLAGQHVRFDVTVQDVREASVEEIQSGRVGGATSGPIQ